MKQAESVKRKINQAKRRGGGAFKQASQRQQTRAKLRAFNLPMLRTLAWDIAPAASSDLDALRCLMFHVSAVQNRPEDKLSPFTLSIKERVGGVDLDAMTEIVKELLDR